MIRAVEAHTLVCGKTRSGKTYLGYKLFGAHTGPAIFCDIQWQRYGEADADVYSVEELVDVLVAHNPDDPWPKIRWLLDNYDEAQTLVPYLKDVHRTHHLRGRTLPVMAVFLDEIWRIAPNWADPRNPAVRIFSEGMQHNLMGVAITQWPSSTSRLIRMNSFDVYLFYLNPQEQAVVERDYHLVPPDWSWLEPMNYHYWRYDGDWWRGDQNGIEVRFPEPGRAVSGYTSPEALRGEDEGRVLQRGTRRGDEPEPQTPAV